MAKAAADALAAARAAAAGTASEGDVSAPLRAPALAPAPALLASEALSARRASEGGGRSTGTPNVTPIEWELFCEVIAVHVGVPNPILGAVGRILYDVAAGLYNE